MRKFLKSKKGVTILEGLIALSLLALVATGTFAVLLSSSRTSSQPDIREEMALAVENAYQRMQMYVLPKNMDLDDVSDLAEDLDKGLCPTDYPDDDPFATNESHNISCLLPPICDRHNSSFVYYVFNLDGGLLGEATNLRNVDRLQKKSATGSYIGADVGGQNAYVLRFDITCNGFTL